MQCFGFKNLLQEKTLKISALKPKAGIPTPLLVRCTEFPQPPSKLNFLLQKIIVI